jgi:hypothetical protein
VRRLHKSFATMPAWAGAAWLATGMLLIYGRTSGFLAEKPHGHLVWLIAGTTSWFLTAGGVYILACKIARRRRRYSSIGVIHQFFEDEQERRK